MSIFNKTKKELMIYNIYTVILLITIAFASCTNDIDNVGNILIDENQNTRENIILQERSTDLPKVEKLIPIKLQTRGYKASEDGSFLGHSYKISNGGYIQGSIDCLGLPVIDIDSIRKYRSSFIQEKRIMANRSNIFTYSNLDKYLNNTRINKMVSSEFSFNSNIFTSWKKKVITNLFDKLVNIEKATLGEVEKSFLYAQYTLAASASYRKLSAGMFQSNIFTKSLYNYPMASILDIYGEFVLTDYYTGGKVYALFACEPKEGITNVKKENDMHAAISASMIEQNNPTNNYLGFIGSNFDVTSTFNSKNTWMFLNTYGGGYTESISRKSIVSFENLNLTPWKNSLKEESNNVMIDIADNSLYPLSAFVIEQNFKQRLDDTFNEQLSPNTELINPRIEIVRYYVRSTPSGEALYDIAAVLVTRQSDRIVLSDGMASSATDDKLKRNDNNDVFLQKVEKIANEKVKLFSSDIEISYNNTTKLNSSLKSPLCIELTGFNENNFYRYYYEKTGVEYIYDPSAHICLSYYVNNRNDVIPEIYGIRNWIESLPRKEISITSLISSYKIIGL